MKKIITIFISFMFVSSVHAATIEEQLTEFKGKLNELEEEVTSLSNNHLNKTYPIGSIYITTTYSTVSAVANALEGTWEVYGSGKTLMGVNTGDTNFNTVNKTGGTSTTALTTSHLPSHTHSIPALSGATSNTSKSLTGSFEARRHDTYSPSDIIWLPENTSDAGIFSHSTALWSGTHGIMARGGDVNNPTKDIISIDATHSHNITTSASTSGPAGTGTSFTNLQPYITVYMYKRIG